MKPHELVERLVREAGGSTAVARSMGKPGFQGTLHKFCAGNVPEPTHTTAKRIAEFFGFPESVIYDDKQATKIYEDRFGKTSETSSEGEKDGAKVLAAPAPSPDEEDAQESQDPLSQLRIGDQEDREEVYEMFRRVARRAKRRKAISDADYRKAMRTIDQWEGLP